MKFSGLHIADWIRGIAAIAIQIVIFQHLTIFGIQSDVLLAYLIWAAANRTRTGAVVLSAGLGLMLDMVTDTWGLHMFTKTLTVFVVYNFIPKENDNKLGWSQVFTTVFLVSLLHQLVLIGVLNFTEVYTTSQHFISVWIAASLYTGFTAGFFNLFRNY